MLHCTGPFRAAGTMRSILARGGPASDMLAHARPPLAGQRVRPFAPSAHAVSPLTWGRSRKVGGRRRGAGASGSGSWAGPASGEGPDPTYARHSGMGSGRGSALRPRSCALESCHARAGWRMGGRRGPGRCHAASFPGLGGPGGGQSHLQLVPLAPPRALSSTLNLLPPSPIHA